MNQTTGSVLQATATPEDPFLPSGSDRVRVLGHRGARVAGRPDNSVAAVTEALLQGADGVEVDIWLTLDGRLVCTHDLPSPAEQSALPTLPEVLAAVQHCAGTQVVVEAKPVRDAAVAARTASVLADVLRTYAGNAAITVSSFDPALLAMIRATCADLPVRTALLGHTADPAAEVVRRASQDGHDEVHLSLGGVRRTPDAVATAHRLGLSVALWTVNARVDLAWVAELGVEAVITDDIVTAWSELDRATMLSQTAAA
ncbi:MAG: glycerophosphodiester phosphodiesterase [Actinomycetes bacterium]